MAESEYIFIVEEKQNGTRNGNMWGPFTQYEAWGHSHRLTCYVRSYGNHYSLTYHVRYISNNPTLPYPGPGFE